MHFNKNDRVINGVINASLILEEKTYILQAIKICLCRKH